MKTIGYSGAIFHDWKAGPFELFYTLSEGSRYLELYINIAKYTLHLSAVLHHWGKHA